MSTTGNPMVDMVDMLRKHFEHASTEAQEFPSGAFVLDVRYDSRLFVVMYTPGQGYGVDEVLEDDGIGGGCTYGCDDTDCVVETLRRIMTIPPRKESVA